MARFSVGTFSRPGSTRREDLCPVNRDWFTLILYCFAARDSVLHALWRWISLELIGTLDFLAHTFIRFIPIAPSKMSAGFRAIQALFGRVGKTGWKV